MSTLAIFCLIMSNLPWFMDLTFQVPMQCCSLQHQILLSSPLTYTTEHRFHFGPEASFLLELSVTVLHSSPGAWWTPAHLGAHLLVVRFLLLHTVHRLLATRMLEWFTVPSSSGPRFVRTLLHEPFVLGAPTWLAHNFIELDKAVIHVISLIGFLWLCFHSVSPLKEG